jgi:hypothetical protein
MYAGSVYGIFSDFEDEEDDDTKVYVGYTIQPLKTRLSKHKSRFRMHDMANKSSCYEILEKGKVRIVELEKIVMETKSALRIALRGREVHHIRMYGENAVNKMRGYKDVVYPTTECPQCKLRLQKASLRRHVRDYCKCS